MKFAWCRTMLALLLLSLPPLEQAVAAELGALRSSRGSPPAVAEFADGQTLVVFAHQDDDLLWMLPFWPVTSRFLLAAYPAAPVFEELVESLPPGLNYGARWISIWNKIDNDLWVETFTERCKRTSIVNLATVKARLRPFFAPPIKRVVTHNNWGEYGHAQHRLVNLAVRQLAVETGLDVWALATRVSPRAQTPSGYVDVAGELGLPTIEGYFDPMLFSELRKFYLARVPTASTPELTDKFRRWSATLWTWSDQPEAFPTGWRPFVKLVDQGSDLTIANSAVSRLEREVTVVNDCPTNPTLPSRP